MPIDRSKYVYESAYGTPRPKVELSPATRLRVQVFAEHMAEKLREVQRIADVTLIRSERDLVKLGMVDLGGEA